MLSVGTTLDQDELKGTKEIILDYSETGKKRKKEITLDCLICQLCCLASIANDKKELKMEMGACLEHCLCEKLDWKNIYKSR